MNRFARFSLRTATGSHPTVIIGSERRAKKCTERSKRKSATATFRGFSGGRRVCWSARLAGTGFRAVLAALLAANASFGRFAAGRFARSEVKVSSAAAERSALLKFCFHEKIAFWESALRRSCCPNGIFDYQRLLGESAYRYSLALVFTFWKLPLFFIIQTLSPEVPVFLFFFLRPSKRYLAQLSLSAALSGLLAFSRAGHSDGMPVGGGESAVAGHSTGDSTGHSTGRLRTVFSASPVLRVRWGSGPRATISEPSSSKVPLRTHVIIFFRK